MAGTGARAIRRALYRRLPSPLCRTAASLHAVLFASELRIDEGLPIWKSAIQQTGSLRYSSRLRYGTHDLTHF